MRPASAPDQLSASNGNASANAYTRPISASRNASASRANTLPGSTGAASAALGYKHNASTNVSASGNTGTPRRPARATISASGSSARAQQEEHRECLQLDAVHRECVHVRTARATW